MIGMCKAMRRSRIFNDDKYRYEADQSSRRSSPQTADEEQAATSRQEPVQVGAGRFSGWPDIHISSETPTFFTVCSLNLSTRYYL